MIELGDKVKCTITGFVGIAVARTEFINGCTQYGVAGRVKKDGKFPEEISIDEESLVVMVAKKKPKEEPSGGPSRRANPMKGY